MILRRVPQAVLSLDLDLAILLSIITAADDDDAYGIELKK